MNKAHVVFDGDHPIYCANDAQACHEHINDAINEFHVEGAEKWKVVKMAAESTAQALPFAVLPEELVALRRFHECAEDGEDYDVTKEMMSRLSEIGLVRRRTGSYYEETIFGLSVLNGDFDAAQTAPEGWKDTLEKIDIKAQAGLCQMTFGGAREFLKDVRNIVKEAAAPSAPIQANSEDAERHELINQVREYIIGVVRAFGEKACADYISTWHQVEHIEQAIAATAQQKECE